MCIRDRAKGWIKDNNCWYAFDDNGAMRTGWIASNEHWYFMGESGVMQADAWVEDNGARYYIKGTGVMAKDYVKDGYESVSYTHLWLISDHGQHANEDKGEHGSFCEADMLVPIGLRVNENE